MTSQGSVLTRGRWRQKRKVRKRWEGKARPERCRVRTQQCSLAGCEAGGKDHEPGNMAGSVSWKQKGNRHPLRATRIEHSPSSILIFRPVRWYYINGEWSNNDPIKVPTPFIQAEQHICKVEKHWTKWMKATNGLWLSAFSSWNDHNFRSSTKQYILHYVFLQKLVIEPLKVWFW